MIFPHFIQKLLTQGLEAFGLYYSKYPGEVIAFEDENGPLGNGKIIVKCTALWPEDTAVNDLPISTPAYGVSHAKKAGLWWPLSIGDAVWIECRQGNPDFPIYGAGWWGDDEVPEDGDMNVRSLRTPAGWELRFEEQPDDGATIMTLKSPDKKMVLTFDQSNSALSMVNGKSTFRLNPDGTFAIEGKDEAISILNDTIAALTQMTTGTLIGPQPPVNLASFIKLAARAESIVE